MFHLPKSDIMINYMEFAEQIKKQPLFELKLKRKSVLVKLDGKFPFYFRENLFGGTVPPNKTVINLNLERSLEDKGSFIRHTHQIRCVALVIVVCTIQLGCAQSRSSGI